MAKRQSFDVAMVKNVQVKDSIIMLPNETDSSEKKLSGMAYSVTLGIVISWIATQIVCIYEVMVILKFKNNAIHV